ncbi:MAG: hypothetical protein IJ708_02580 [Clostridia bacterium]|nr:hypothetical protein [Clostridia bacterium]
MKKCIAALLMLLVLMTGSAYAKTTELFVSEELESTKMYGSLQIQSTAKVGDTVWFMVQNGNNYGLYKWQEGMEDAVCVQDGLYLSTMYGGKEYFEKFYPDVDATYLPSWLFAYEDELASLNLYTGQLFTIREENGTLVYTDVPVGTESGKIDPSHFYGEEADLYLGDTRFVSAKDGVLRAGVPGWSDDGWQILYVYTISFSDGSVSRAEFPNISVVTEGKDREIYAMYRDEANAWDPVNEKLAPYTLVTLDLANGKMEEIETMPDDAYVSNMVYQPSLDAIVYSIGTKLMTLGEDGKFSQVGFLVNDVYDQASMIPMDDRILITSWQGAFLRDVSRDFNTDRQVTTSGFYNSDAQRFFAREEPDVPVYRSETWYDTSEKLLEGMKNGDMDIIGMQISYSQFNAVRDKGYCEPLSASQTIVDFVKREYPVFASEGMYRDQVVALPYSVYSYDGLTYHGEIMEEVGLTEDDMPTNFLDLCRFITMWNDDYAEDYPDVLPLQVYGDLKQELTYDLIRRYVNYCRAEGEMISFSAPMFREIMEAIESIHTDNLQSAPNSEEDGYDEEAWDAYYMLRSLMEFNNTIVGRFEGSVSGVSDNTIPLALTADSPAYTYVYLSVVFINPYSTHKQDALKYLECLVESIKGTRTEYLLCADMTEPLLNPDYDLIVENYKQALELTEQRLANPAEDDDVESLKESLDYLTNAMQNLESEMRYTVSEAHLKWYQEEIAPIMRVAQRTFLTSTENDANTELSTLVGRLSAGQMTLDQFIREADGKLRMMQLEDE